MMHEIDCGAMTHNPYEGLDLPEAVYDRWHGALTARDVPFYRKWIARCPGPVLEVGCGTGRVMLPLMRDGVEIEGLDASAAMLAVCRGKAGALGLAPVLHQGMMQDVDLGRRFSTILVPFRSFTLVTGRGEARRALERFREHLMPGGQVILSFFVPDYAKTAAQDGTWRRTVELPWDEPGTRVVISDCIRNDLVEQLKWVSFRFDLMRGEEVVRSEQQDIVMRWYFRHEMELMLERAGFEGIEAFGDFGEEKARDGHGEMTFRAVAG